MAHAMGCRCPSTSSSIGSRSETRTGRVGAMMSSPWWRRWQGWMYLAVALLSTAFAVVNAVRGQGFTDQAGLAVTWTVFAVYLFIRALRRRT